ncbi:MAG: SO_0444 family Cu/Zn efflux transporter [Candidatus Neomarinimicrobiota bacterium]
MFSTILHNLAHETWLVLTQMGPYLLFGFLVAGILSVYISPEWVERHLGGRGLFPAVKAALFGVPLPLCSCGVIPVAASIYRHGASRSATTSFLLSTPQTGVDSIMVTYALLGPVFAIFRPVIALLTGIIGGGIVQLADNNSLAPTAPESDHDHCDCDSCETASKHGKLAAVLRYGFITLPKDIGPALLVGILIAGVIGALVPPDYLGGLIGGGIVSILILMAAGVPVYVCATASVPIAAGFIHMGASPGAALAFLVAGPATNAATFTTIMKVLGKRTAGIYLGTVAVSAVASGLLLNYLVPAMESILPQMTDHIHGGDSITWFSHLTAVVLIAVVAFAYFYRPAPEKIVTEEATMEMETVTFKVSGMTCSHCAMSVKRAAEEAGGATAEVDLAKGKMVVHGKNINSAQIIAAVNALGYEASLD